MIIYTCLKPIYHTFALLWNRIHLSGIQTISYAILTIITENIQIYFTKILFYICNLTKRSYEDRIIFLNIKTLFHRRLLADLTLTYKILNGLIDVDATDIFYIYSNNCRGPKVNIRKKKCRTNAHLNYFGNRVCSSWNALPFTITSCKTVTLFREKLIHT